ncbi:MAG: hypothetical protein JOY72_04790 [Actinobacteria bacterium]|nr:hypothetical protein [Actinomycetota bacterium]MBV8479602.1 hypothetical protein [Actinomycetota bacterium]
MSEETEKALDQIAEDQRTLVEGLEAEAEQDHEGARGKDAKRPWWKVWARADPAVNP